ncbi:MAG: hypothetical protein AB7U98_05170 [Candidatus Nitrosocosmicus sp.]
MISDIDFDYTKGSYIGPSNPLTTYDILISRGCDMVNRYGKIMVGCATGYLVQMISQREYL